MRNSQPVPYRTDLDLGDMMYRALTILFVTVFISSSVSAQRFGDGRILRRIFRVEPEANLEALQAAEKAKVPQRVPQPANPYARQPQPGYNPAARPNTPRPPYPTTQNQYRPTPPRRPTTASPQSQQVRSQTKSSTNRLEPIALPAPPQYRQNPAAQSQMRKPYVQRRAPSQQYRTQTIEAPKSPKSNKVTGKKIFEHDGFGMTVRQSGDRIVVVHLVKDGMAQLAGVKKGDVLESIGTIPVEEPADVAQLDKVLEPGDQVEFEFARKKRTKKFLISFKEEMPVGETGDREEYASAAAPGEVQRLEELVQSQQQLIDDLRGRLSSLENSQSEFDDEFAIEEQSAIVEKPLEDKPLLILQ